MAGNLRPAQNLGPPDRAENFEFSSKSVPNRLENNSESAGRPILSRFRTDFGPILKKFHNFRPDQEVQDFARDASHQLLLIKITVVQTAFAALVNCA